MWPMEDEGGGPAVGGSLGVLADDDWCLEKVHFWEGMDFQIDRLQLDDKQSDNIVRIVDRI